MYTQLRKLLFRRDPEDAHNSAVSLLENLSEFAPGRVMLRSMGGRCPSEPVHAMGLEFRHPVGLAAGFDKNAHAVLGLQELGFSSVEVGTVTPRAQPGNVLPRLWRFPESEALVNSLGFPGDGMLEVRRRLERFRKRRQVRIPIGVNLGKNSATPAESAVEDYRKVLDELYEVGDFFVVNVSSPNTPGLRDLQAVEYLAPILETLANRANQRGGKPLLVKIAPDLADDDVAAIGRLARELNLAGVVAANTTVRRELASGAERTDRGGLSGSPLYSRTKDMIALLRKELGPEQSLIASGGICSAERLREILSLGANLVQVYTAFIYLGPRCVRKLLSTDKT